MNESKQEGPGREERFAEMDRNMALIGGYPDPNARVYRFRGEGVNEMAVGVYWTGGGFVVHVEGLIDKDGYLPLVTTLEDEECLREFADDYRTALRVPYEDLPFAKGLRKTRAAR